MEFDSDPLLSHSKTRISWVIPSAERSNTLVERLQSAKFGGASVKHTAVFATPARTEAASPLIRLTLWLWDSNGSDPFLSREFKEERAMTAPFLRVILGEAKDLLSTRAALAVEARSFASLRMTGSFRAESVQVETLQRQRRACVHPSRRARSWPRTSG